MSSPSAGNRRMNIDVIKLIESKHEVTILVEGLNKFCVKLFGPRDTPYEGGVWKARSVNVINQAWTPLYDLSNIFECFLPQLLTYPNPIDPVNGDAAAMYLHKPDKYKKKVRSYIQMYATPDKLESSESKPNPFLSFLPILNPIPTLARFYPILAKFTSMACLRLALLRKVREAMFTHNVYYLEVSRASGQVQ
ncbi:hypothetical protein M8J76_007783 [Diaphorina citri]|nr:hypothetical protein M8J76_007783 [Diaphorina citri]